MSDLLAARISAGSSVLRSNSEEKDESFRVKSYGGVCGGGAP